MKPTTQPAANQPAQPARDEPRQTIAIGICGAIGGASVFEVFASAWLHPAASVATQPTAGPLALAGALIGVALTLLVRRQWHRTVTYSAQTPEIVEASLLADTVPLTPMAWQPVPLTPLQTAPLTFQEPAVIASPREAQHEVQAAGTCPHAHGRLGRRAGRPTFHQTPAPRRMPAQG